MFLDFDKVALVEVFYPFLDTPKLFLMHVFKLEFNLFNLLLHVLGADLLVAYHFLSVLVLDLILDFLL